ncbi:MAG: hypothetical protein JWL69_3988 [Phycisphaerales bacterium]|jgi:hypothetical protein|nr:hypothetical protein [Phycisphaerales bacterium]MDB5356597.1 hypothetical protein [Phycisphaerales bacterium]
MPPANLPNPYVIDDRPTDQSERSRNTNLGNHLLSDPNLDDLKIKSIEPNVVNGKTIGWLVNW